MLSGLQVIHSVPKPWRPGQGQQQPASPAPRNAGRAQVGIRGSRCDRSTSPGRLSARSAVPPHRRCARAGRTHPADEARSGRRGPRSRCGGCRPMGAALMNSISRAPRDLRLLRRLLNRHWMAGRVQHILHPRGLRRDQLQLVIEPGAPDPEIASSCVSVRYVSRRRSHQPKRSDGRSGPSRLVRSGCMPHITSGPWADTAPGRGGRRPLAPE